MTEEEQTREILVEIWRNRVGKGFNVPKLGLKVNCKVHLFIAKCVIVTGLSIINQEGGVSLIFLSFLFDWKCY